MKANFGAEAMLLRRLVFKSEVDVCTPRSIANVVDHCYEIAFSESGGELESSKVT